MTNQRAEFLPALYSRGNVAPKLESDIILPKSSVKPEYRGSLVRSVRSLFGDRQVHAYPGPIVLGVRDVSRDLQFKSSYTLVAADALHTQKETARFSGRTRESKANIGLLLARARVLVHEFLGSGSHQPFGLLEVQPTLK
jgi:hypothetical protein